MGVGSGLSSLSALSCPPPACTHSTLSTLCTTAPFPVVLWQCTQLRLPCSPSGDLQSARLLGLLLMFVCVKKKASQKLRVSPRGEGQPPPPLRKTLPPHPPQWCIRMAGGGGAPPPPPPLPMFEADNQIFCFGAFGAKRI